MVKYLKILLGIFIFSLLIYSVIYKIDKDNKHETAEAVLNRMSNPFVVLEGYANTDKNKYKLKFNDSNILNSNNSNDFNAGSSNGSGGNSGGGAF